MADTATVVAMILLIAFAIDRVIAALTFVYEFIRLPKEETPETKTKRDDYRKRLVWFFIAATLSALALLAFHLPDKVKLPIDSNWNGPLLWLILVGGADRISQFLGTPSPPAASPGGTKELHIAGTLTLDRESTERLNTPDK